MNGDRILVSADGSNVFPELRPAGLLHRGIALGLLRKIVRHGSFSGQAPHRRIGAPAGYQITPMPFHFFDAENRKVIAPATDNAWHDIAFHQMPDAHRSEEHTY